MRSLTAKAFFLISLVSLTSACATTTYVFSPKKGASKQRTVHHNLMGQEFSPFRLKENCPDGVKSVTISHGFVSIFTSIFVSSAGVDSHGYNPLDLEYRCLR